MSEADTRGARGVADVAADGATPGVEGTASAGRRGRTPSAAVERELVAAAEAVLVRDGPGGLTVRAVTVESGIAPMSVYNRLGGKDGLVDALLVIGFGRLRAGIESSVAGALADLAAPGGGKADMLAWLRDCGLRYRDFALANPHFYAIMFEDAIPNERESAEVWEGSRAAFGVLLRLVEITAATGRIAAPDPTETAQQIWSAIHGAVGLELKGLVLTPDPSATYSALLDTIIHGLAPRGRGRRRPQEKGTVATREAGLGE